MSKTKKAKASELSKRVWYTVGLLLLVGTAFICLVGVADKVKENKKSLVGRPSRGDGLSRNGDPGGEGTIAEQLEEDVQLKTAARDADTEGAAKASSSLGVTPAANLRMDVAKMSQKTHTRDANTGRGCEEGAPVAW